MNKLFLWLILLVIVLFIGILFCFIPFDNEVSNSIQAIGVCGALLLSLIASVYAAMEFQHHKKATKTALICRFIQRYANDNNAKNIEQYILEAALIDQKTGKIIGYNKDAELSHIPTIREKERFMHIFEELQLYIDSKMIPLPTAIDIFGYYVSVFDQIEEFHSDITDYNNENFWKNYIKFTSKIPKGFYLQ